MKKKKPRKPQDSTRRNIQAANKHFDRLEAVIEDLQRRVTALETPAEPPPPQ